MSTQTVVVVEPQTTVVEVSETEAVVVSQTVTETVTVGIAGPQGPAGPTGATGATGAAGAPGTPGGSYTHVQAVPASVWTVAHGLGWNPNVTVLNSAGDVVEGGIAYPDANTLVLSFSGAFAGTAYLS